MVVPVLSGDLDGELSADFLSLLHVVIPTLHQRHHRCGLLLYKQYIYLVIHSIPHWPLPAVRDLTRDGRLSTYDESVLKLSKVSYWGKCTRTGHPLKLPSPTKLARLGHFPPASQAGRLAGPVFYV